MSKIMIEIFCITIGIMFIIMGMVERPSRLPDPVNTAAIVYLFGWLILILALLNLK